MGQLTVLFWLAVGLLAWVYLGYPLLALIKGSLTPVRLSLIDGPPAMVTVGIAIHEAGDEITDRLRDILAQEVPFPLEIIVCLDGPDERAAQVVRRLAERGGRVKLLELARRGQSAAQAAIFEAARGDVVVLTDVETRFAPGCLMALVAPFADPRVGVVTGVLDWRFEEPTNTARHEGLYWRYEQRVRAWESRAGWLSAGTGALLAVRRDIYRPVPSHASLDQMLPLIARQEGSLVLVAPDARGADRGPSSVGEQIASRTRIATQGIEANLRMSLHIAPWRQPGVFVAIWSHKLLRWATPWLVLVALVGATSAWFMGGSWVYLVPLAVLVVLVVLAVAARWLPGRLTGLAVTVGVVNGAFARAWLAMILRRRAATWEPAGGSAHVGGSPPADGSQVQ